MATKNYTTLTDMKEKKKKMIIKKKSPRKGQYHKRSDFKNTLTTIYKINDNCEGGNIIPIPLKVGEKSPKRKFAEGQWTVDKAKEMSLFTADTPCDWDTEKCELGITMTGNINALDFDCEADWKWFNDTYKLDLSKYLVETNTGKHNCGCDTETEQTHKIYFEATGFFLGNTHNTACIKDDEEKPRLIDYLAQYSTGCPQICKVPQTTKQIEGERHFSNIPKDYKIIPLPIDVVCGLESRWITRGSRTDREKTEYTHKFLTLANLITPNLLSGKEFRIVCFNLLQNDISEGSIIDYGLSLWRDKTYPNRIGVGNNEFTELQMRDWFEYIFNDFSQQDTDYPAMIMKKAKESNGIKFQAINIAGLSVYGNHFDKAYLADIKRYILCEDRGTYITKYYNRFFKMVSGKGDDNCLYQLVYDNDGAIEEIIPYSKLQNFYDYCGLDMTINGSEKQKNTAQFWIKGNSQVYNAIDYIPYGIKGKKRNIPKKCLNLFCGYNMKAVPNYNNEEWDWAGDIINDQIKYGLCWDNIDGKSSDIKVYNWFRKWLYQILITGQRPKSAVVFYSEEFGTGKSQVSNNFLKFCIGLKNGSVCSSFKKLMEDNFTDAFEDKSLMVVEEMPKNAKEFATGWEYLKSLTTEDTGASRKIYKSSKIAKWWLSFWFNTNNFASMDAGYCNRRAMLNRVNTWFMLNDYIGGKEEGHFTKLAKATECYEGWENFVHRYLLNDSATFENVVVLPIENLIPKTRYRTELMRRGADPVVYFMKDYLESVRGDTEDPYEHIYNKHIYINDLWREFDCFREANYEWYKTNREKFKEKLSEKFNLDFKAVVETGEQPQTGSKNTAITILRKKAGHCFIMTKALVNTFRNIISKTTIDNDNSDTICMTTEELKQHRLNISLNDIDAYETTIEEENFY
jgi:hypothetical protein